MELRSRTPAAARAHLREWPPQRYARLMKDHGVGVICAAMLVFLLLTAALAPVLAKSPPDYQDFSALLERPSVAHPLGTDDLGRDVLSRLLYGARISLAVGICATFLAAAIGVTLGLMSGYLGGWIDTVIMRAMDVILAFPTLVLAVAIVGALGPSLANATVAITVVIIPRFARIVRAEVLRLATLDFITAAIALGASEGRILVRHILPNTVGMISVQVSLSIATAILNEASLSFLGLGVQPPTPSWGGMLRAGYPFLSMAPWIAISAGCTITLVVLLLTFVGDAIRDYLDPRLRSR